MSKVLCLGDSCADIIIPYGESLVKEVEVTFSCGGACANSAVFLGKFNVNTAFCGKAGKDIYGLKMLKEFKENGVDTSYFDLDPDLVTTQILVVIDENNDRHPFLMPKKEPSYLAIHEDDLNTIDLKDTEYILTNGMMLFDEPAASSILSFLQKAHEKGIRILLDLNFRNETGNKDRKYLNRVIALTDYLLGSVEDDILFITGKKDIHEALNTLNNQVVIAHNEHGAYYKANNEISFVEGYKVQIKDTLGAGDVFNAGFIYGLVHQCSLHDCLKYANAAAALSITKSGARNAPAEKELLEFLGNQ